MLERKQTPALETQSDHVERVGLRRLEWSTGRGFRSYETRLTSCSLKKTLRGRGIFILLLFNVVVVRAVRNRNTMEPRTRVGILLLGMYTLLLVKVIMQIKWIDNDNVIVARH